MHHGWKLLLLGCFVSSGCDRDRAESRGTPADTTTRRVEDAAELAALLAPLRAISRATVEYGQLAAQRAESSAVRQYGQTVAADHRAVLTLLDDTAQQRGVTLSETGQALDLANMVRMAHSGLENLTGPDFDLPFVRAEVESHRQLLDRLDQHAIPAAPTADLRDMLSGLRAMADAHLTRARQLLASELGELAAPPPPPPRTTPVPRPPPPDTGRQPPADTTRQPQDTVRRPPPDTSSGSAPPGTVVPR